MGELHERLFDFQRDIVSRMLSLGRGAIFASTGLGKTGMQIEWAAQVHNRGHGDILIFAPLAVAQQTAREAKLFGVNVTVCREPEDVRPGVNITNYDRLAKFDLARFGGVVLDESSILKATDGKTRTALIEASQFVRFRLACTATPAPNDVMELGNHAEFLGVMRATEMLATYFVHDGGDTQKWRLKGHAERSFWQWVGSWSSVVDSPADMGYDGSAYELPPLVMHEHILDAPAVVEGETLFALPAASLTERRAARSVSVDMRVNRAAEIIWKEWEKTECLGSPNMQNGGGSSINQTQQNASDANHSAELLKKIKHTCEIGTPKIVSEPQNISAENSTNDAQDKESDTHLTLNTEQSASRQQRLAQLTSDATQRSDRSTESRRSNTMICLPGNSISVQSAARITPKSASSGLTIATQEGMSGDSCATDAISASATSGTARKNSKRRLDTLGPWLIWCGLNREQDALTAAFGENAFSVYGAMAAEEKERQIMGWLAGERPIMISKASMMGFGLNFQHCSRMTFVGIDDSWESLYQAIRRCWRFGQTQPVDVHLILSSAEIRVLENLKRKERDAARMRKAMAAEAQSVTVSHRIRSTYSPVSVEVPSWIA